MRNFQINSWTVKCKEKYSIMIDSYWTRGQFETKDLIWSFLSGQPRISRIFLRLIKSQKCNMSYDKNRE